MQYVSIFSIEKLIGMRKLDWVGNGITDKRFPTPARIKTNCKAFNFGIENSSAEAIAQMRMEGYEQANSHELLLWDEWNEKTAVVALGSVANDNKVLCLDNCSGGLILCSLTVIDWRMDLFYLLGVLKSSDS